MIRKSTWNAVWVGTVLLILAGVLWACTSAAEPTATPVAAPTVAPTATTAPADPAPAVAAEVVTETTATTATATMTSTVAMTETAAAVDTGATTQVFVIDPTQSVARYTLDEELMGAPKTVVGTTSLVSGEITINPAEPANATIGTIQIDARDFATDSGRRDGAVRRFVLASDRDEYQYIVFTPTAISGLPSTAQVGDSFEIQVTGDLTISGTTQPVTFVTTVTVDSATQIRGLAQTQVLRSEFNLNIPSVPSVANVTDEVQLELEFVAMAGG